MTDKTETATLSSDATEVRAQKLKLLREQIGDVYPAHFHRTITNAELAAKYEGLEPDIETQDVVTVAGRVYSSRNSGMFMDLRDASGKIQIFSHKDVTGEEARALLPMIDIGDIIGVTGIVRRTKRGELTINAQADHHADEVAAADAREVARPLRYRAALPQAPPRHHDQRGIEAPLPAAFEDRLRHPPFHGKRRLHGSRDADAAFGLWRRDRRTVQDASQHAEARHVPAHRAGTVPEAHAGLGPHRQGLRDQPQLPQRRRLDQAQSRIHDDGVLLGLCRLRGHHGPRRAAVRLSSP